MEFSRAENTVDLVGFVRIGYELASPRDCCPQPLVSEIAPVCVELVESGDLRPQYFFDGVSLLKHLHSSVNTRVVRPAAPRGELLSDQSQDRGLECFGIAGNFRGKLAAHAGSEIVNEAFQLLQQKWIACACPYIPPYTVTIREAWGTGAKLFELIWLPPRDSNPDMLIQSRFLGFSITHRSLRVGTKMAPKLGRLEPFASQLRG